MIMGRPTGSSDIRFISWAGAGETPFVEPVRSYVICDSLTERYADLVRSAMSASG